MPDIKGKVKNIIMDKSPKSDNMNMKADFGFNGASYDELTDALNQEFSKSYTTAQIAPLGSVKDVVDFVTNN